MASLVYQFGEFQLDCGRFELSRNGRAVAVERKPMELLILLAQSKGQLLTRTEIAARLWESEVFVDTEHGINTAIRKIRYTLRDDAVDPRFVQTVTGKGYRFVAPVQEWSGEELPCQGEPVLAGERAAAALLVASAASSPKIEGHALFHTSAQSIAPGTMGPATTVPATTVPGSGGRRWSMAVAAAALLLALLAAGAGVHSWMRHRAAQAGIRSLAVLPLDNLSGDAQQEYFADGMTDELTTMLAKNSTLRIVSRTSVMQYKRAHRPVREIAQALGVDGILEGSVSRSGDQVHMNLQLIRADSDAHLWAESYDRSLDASTQLPGEAARQIAGLLNRATLAPAPRYVNPQAHDAYLRGEFLWPTDQMEQSGAYFRKATEIQPDYAAAWAGLANYYGEGIAGDVFDPRTTMAQEEQAAKRALQLDPDLAEAHQAMGAAYFLDQWDWNDADREFQRATNLDPSDAETYYVRACLMQAMHRDAEAIALGKKMMELNPFVRPAALASFYIAARQFDEGLADLRLRLEASPNNPDLLATEMDAWRREGNYKEAVAVWAKWHMLTGQPQAAAELLRAYATGGALGFVRWQLERRLAQAETSYVSPVELATFYAQLAEKDKTLDLLEEGLRQRSTDMLWIDREPAFDFLHDNSRYRAIVQTIGEPAAR